MTVGYLIHYKQRRGAGPVWDLRTAEIWLDDLEPDTSEAAAMQAAKEEFYRLMNFRGVPKTAYRVRNAEKI